MRRYTNSRLPLPLPLRAVKLYCAKMTKLIEAENFRLTRSDFNPVDFLLQPGSFGAKCIVKCKDPTL